MGTSSAMAFLCQQFPTREFGRHVLGRISARFSSGMVLPPNATDASDPFDALGVPLHRVQYREPMRRAEVHSSQGDSDISGDVQCGVSGSEGLHAGR